MVEQYKTRRDGTWSIADIISVLGDLRKAVSPTRSINARYRFVTDGKPGRLEPFTAFLADVTSANGLDDLDCTEKRTFSKDLVLSHREFFDHIVVSVSQSPGFLEQSAVFHLLTHFEMEFGSDGDEQAEAVEKLLRCYGPDLGDERGLRERLVGILIETLSKGETRLDAAKIGATLRRAGINSDRLHRLARLPETLGARTMSRLSRVGYNEGKDVRNPPRFFENKRVLLIAGASGAGKTWQLAGLLRDLITSRQISTLILDGRTRSQVLDDAARDVWQTGLNETSDKTLAAVCNFLGEFVSNTGDRQITVAVDDVQDIDLARSLVRQDWAEWDSRLVMTAPLSVARALEGSDRAFVHTHSVGDFSIDELDRLLERNGRSWSALPPDLKTLLRNPILAGLFLEMPYVSVQSAPRSEYEIFEAFWSRIAAKGRSGDEGIAIGLASLFLDGRPYPLARQSWNDIGLSEDSLARLDAAGWLLADENGSVAFAHDRLLNWAVSKSIAMQAQQNQSSPERLVALLANATGGLDTLVKRRLGYVAMDTLWLLSETAEVSERLGAVIENLEDSREFGSYGEELYAHLLPTLGQRAIPILLGRIDTITASGGSDYRIKLIAQAFANLARQDHVELEPAVGALLRTESRDRQSIAIAALTASPDPSRLDRLWQLHQRNVDALEEKTDNNRHGDYEARFAALRAGVAKCPDWLRRRIGEANQAQEHVSELGYLLNGLDHADASSIWKNLGDVLIAKSLPDKPRSLLYCIARFRDHAKLDFVISYLSRSEDFASGVALYALTVLDPRAAIQKLLEVDDAERSLTRNSWLPALLHAEPKLTREHLLTLARTEKEGRRTIEDLFGERPDEMDEHLLTFVLRALESDLSEHLDAALAGDPIWLYHPLRVLGRITRPALLAVVAAERDGNLERMVAAVACSRSRVDGRFRDHVREEARQFLILVGGEGITMLLKQELESEHYWVRHGALNWAFVRKDAGIIDRLAAIARRPLPRDDAGNIESDAYSEFYQAMNALAALGADAVLVEVAHASEVSELPRAAADLRAFQGPMPKTLTDRAVGTLARASVAETELKVALVVAWMSGDDDLVPAVRSVLERADPASTVAGLACIALMELGDESDEFGRLALCIAQSSENGLWGLNGMMSLGDRGAPLLLEWLETSDAETRGKHEDLVIRELYAHPATRAQAVAAAVARCRRSHRFGDVPYDVAAEENDPALRDRIFDKAFAGHSLVITEPLAAIEGLAKFDVTHAVDAIELALQNYPKIENQLCGLLVQIAPELAARKLVDISARLQRESLRKAIGRKLRSLDPAIVSALVLDLMKGSNSERKTAAELAAWLPIPGLTEALGRLADDDTTSDVRHAALLALERHRQEASLRALFDMFETASYDERWRLLVTIVNAADPHLLTKRDDPLWLGKIISDKIPYVFEWYANEEIHARKQNQ